MDTRGERIRQWKLLANEFAKMGIKVFIKDFNDEYYFGKLTFVGDATLEIQCDNPPNKIGKKYLLYWNNIWKFDNYKEDQ